LKPVPSAAAAGKNPSKIFGPHPELPWIVSGYQNRIRKV
jgi:hypothetical protein